VGLDHRAAYREPEADAALRALRRGAMEFLEEALFLVCRNAGPRSATRSSRWKQSIPRPARAAIPEAYI
jgi:hypothetical protein